MHSFKAVGILWEVKAIFFYLLSVLQFLLPLILTGSTFTFSSVYVKMLHQDYTDRFHLGS